MPGTWVQTKDAQSSAATVDVSLTGVVAGNHLNAQEEVVSDTGTPAATAPTSTPAATWTVAVADFGFSATQRSGVWYSENVASGAWTVTCNSSGTGVNPFSTGHVSESSGVRTSASLGVTNSGTASATASVQPGSITPTAGSVLYTGFGNSGGNTALETVDSAFTIRGDAAGRNGAVGLRADQASKDNVAATAVNPTWTESSGTANWNAVIVEFLQAAIPPPFPPSKLVVG